MFKFLKSLFGMDKTEMKDAGVQLEQAPYKLEPPQEILIPQIQVVGLDHVVIQPFEEPQEPMKTESKKKAPAVKTTGAKRGPKPKVKA